MQERDQSLCLTTGGSSAVGGLAELTETLLGPEPGSMSKSDFKLAGPLIATRPCNQHEQAQQ